MFYLINSIFDVVDPCLSRYLIELRPLSSLTNYIKLTCMISE
jgi:hypothetical protein